VIWRFLWSKFKGRILETVGLFIFGILLIFILFQFTDFRKVISLISSSPARADLSLFFFLALYFIFKFIFEWFLISKLKLRVALKKIILLFGLAELTREFPTIPILMGLTVVSRRAREFFPPKLFSILILQMPLEFTVCFLILAVFGFANLPFLRPLALLGALVIFGFLIFLKRFPIPSFLERGKIGGKISRGLSEFKEGVGEVFSFWNLTFSYFLSFGYFLSLGTVLFFVSRACGFEGITLTDAWSVFAINYVLSVLIPLPGDWGISEASGFILLLALGGSRETALASILTFRILYSAVTWIFSGVTFWLLRREIHRFFVGLVKKEVAFT
jgi:hypothetical protein